MTKKEIDLWCESNLPVMSVAGLIIRLLVVVSLVELSIMMLFAQLQLGLNPIVEALLDVAILGLLSSPLIYFWVIRPFISARDIAEASVKYLALHDSLTELPNRRLLEEHLELAINRCVREEIYAAVMLIDLDHFKPINDTHGHAAGDAVLKDTGIHLLRLIRESDLAARLGGDEFVVLLSTVGSDEAKAHRSAEAVAKKIRKAIAHPVHFNGAILEVNCSIGITLIGPEKTTVERLLRDADTAMYEAKQAGRAQVRMFE